MSWGSWAWNSVLSLLSLLQPLLRAQAGPTSGCCSLQPATGLSTRNGRLLLENPPITTPSFKIMLSKSLISIKEDDEENLYQGLLTNDCLVLFLQVIFLKHWMYFRGTHWNSRAWWGRWELTRRWERWGS